MVTHPYLARLSKNLLEVFHADIANLARYKTLQACASISVPKLCNFHLQYLVNFVKN